MLLYYFFTIIVTLTYFINKKLGYSFIIIGLPIFLILLPTTGLDYDYYKQSYDNAAFTINFPYFSSASQLTAEPLYIWYTSIISVITKLSFPFFLAINFLICTKIITYSFPTSQENTHLKYYLFLYLLPVVIPTIFYFSPRSSVSFVFILFGFFTLFYNKKLTAGVAFLLIGLSFHSQFVLVSFYILILYILSFKIDIYSKSAILLVNIILAAALFIFLYFIGFFETIIASLFSFLPSASIAVAKLHYISGEDSASGSFRMTSILSILIYPIILLFFLKKIDLQKSVINKSIIFGITGIVFFGTAVNLAFLNDAHVAGRLARFSDYFCMGFLIPYTLYINSQYFLIKFIALLMCILAPFLFSTLYINAFEIL